MITIKNKIVSILITLSMILVLVPAIPVSALNAFAEDSDITTTTSEQDLIEPTKCICDPVVSDNEIHTNIDCPLYKVDESTTSSENTSSVDNAEPESQSQMTEDLPQQVAAGEVGYEFKYDGVNYIVTVFETEVSVKSKTSSLSDITIPSYVYDSNETYYDVTGISNSAFKAATNLITIYIEDGIKTIGVDAFNGCTKLEEISIPSTVTKIDKFAFKGCTKLTEVTIPANVTTIGDSAFYGCTNIAKVIFKGNAPKSMGEKVFQNTKSPLTVVCPPTATGYDDAFKAKFPTGTIFGGVYGKLCSDKLFYKTDKTGAPTQERIYDPKTITNLFIAEDVLAIPNSVVLSSQKEPNATLGEVVFLGTSQCVTIDRYAFNHCTALTKVVIPASVSVIDENAFYNCKSLASVDLSNATNLQSIGNSAFEKCTALTKIVILANVTSIGNSSFSGCTKLATVDLSKATNLQSIGDSTFSGCTRLTECDLSKATNLQSIGNDCFKGCTKIPAIDLKGNASFVSFGNFSNLSISF